jgi:hypothetical protein
MTEQLRPEQVLSSVESMIAPLFPGSHASFLLLVFEKTKGLFEGKYPGYQGCDTVYHNFSHTCDVMIATARILDGHIKSGETPSLNRRDFELAMAAALLHDSGLIKEAGDTGGTGAKYTLTHVARGAHFAEGFLLSLGVTPGEIHTVQISIRCTQLNVNLSRLEFGDERERFLGCVLAAGDLLGQMAAPDYPERLPSLYAEQQEALNFAPRQPARNIYANTDELLVQTRDFYETNVKRQLNSQWASVNRALTHHFASGRNELLDAVENNLARIDLILANSQSPSLREHHHV